MRCSGDSLFGFSTKTEREDEVLIDAMAVAEAFVFALVRGVHRRKARPCGTWREARVQRELS